MDDVLNGTAVKNKKANVYQEYILKKQLILIVLGISVVLLAVMAMNAGTFYIGLSEIAKTLIGQSSGAADIVIWNIRLPRVTAAIIGGAGLSVAGCVMQTCLCNKLASPTTLGISAAAAFGANLAIVFLGAGQIQSNTADAVNIYNPYAVTITAFVCSLLAMVLILSLAKIRNFSPESMVLAGVAFGSLFSAGSTLVQYFAQDVQVAAMVYWTFGDLGRVAWQEISILAVLVITAMLYFIMHRLDYNALDTGTNSAKGLGVNVEKVRLVSMALASLITAAAVAFMGIIAFIGLIGPQIMRRIIGGDHRFLLPASALMGSVILLFADTAARALIAPITLPVGAVTSFLGAPLFLYLLARGHSRR